MANQLDGQGNPVVTLWQDAYGNRIADMNTGEWASIQNRAGRGLTTKEYDSDATLYYFWQRWDDPETGRFVSEDIFPPYFEHPYSISHNNPILFNDPLGLSPKLVVMLPVIGIDGSSPHLFS